ncbi:uncharacterized protein AB675_10493 [Cyphellophora attinorum]|uniref:F-box domain-containing protein n=1 Tax=Cyphellophora attinorum TaxID=1664694 RepID=A0A0N0NIW1_9EURO|nr:uncharacterized protein AB675_10493 [Phialophora attinorum]KPI35909.1 hypothetical protein AB675_10493 [Phialophora attinorum]
MAALKREREEAVAFSSRVAKRGKPSEEPLRLLSLPSEIRALILRELLTSDEPLFYDRDRSKPRPQLWPKVLQTCKQVYEEGRQLLYSNALGIHIGNPNPVGIRVMKYPIGPREYGRWVVKEARTHVLAHSYDLDSSRSQLGINVVEGFSKISIRIRLDDSNDMETLRLALENIVREAPEGPNWAHISLVLDGDDRIVDETTWRNFTWDDQNFVPRSRIPAGRDEYESELDIIADEPNNGNKQPRHLSSYILQPLLRWRERELGDCVGIAGDIAEKLRSQMRMPMSGRIQHLDIMLDELRDYCFGILGRPDPKEDYTAWDDDTLGAVTYGGRAWSIEDCGVDAVPLLRLKTLRVSSANDGLFWI